MQTHASPESPVLIKKMNPHLLISVFLKISYSIFFFFIHFLKIYLAFQGRIICLAPLLL